MTLGVLELNDAGITIGDGAGLSAESPGYATLDAAGITLGEAARARARLDPLRTYTRFWQRLGTEPLHNAPPHARHHADLAWQHLQHVHSVAGGPAEIILAVPGSFTREQLGILLGISERCAFRAVGLVDSALAAATQAPCAGDGLLHLELQLHQCVLTRLDLDQDSLVRREARVLPGTGLVELQERWARRAAAAFIQQTRFDPLHDAASEQQLYARLPSWIARLGSEDDTAAELSNGTNRYLARLRAADMLDAVESLYQEISASAARDGAGRTLLLGARAARLPRFAARVGDPCVLAADATAHGALAHTALIRSEERALRFVTRLPAPTAPRAITASPPVPQPAPTVPLATHLLHANTAMRLDAGPKHLCRHRDGSWRLAPGPVEASLCTFARTAAGWAATPAPGARMRIDGQPADETTVLRTGARLAFDDGAELRLIAESTDHDDGA